MALSCLLLLGACGNNPTGTNEAASESLETDSLEYGSPDDSADIELRQGDHLDVEYARGALSLDSWVTFGIYRATDPSIPPGRFQDSLPAGVDPHADLARYTVLIDEVSPEARAAIEEHLSGLSAEEAEPTMSCQNWQRLAWEFGEKESPLADPGAGNEPRRFTQAEIDAYFDEYRHLEDAKPSGCDG